MDYANGTISDWGVHWFNQVLQWTDEKYPKNIFSKGDRYYKTDGADVPDTQLAIYEFEGFILEWEHKMGALNDNEDHNVGCYFYGSEGTLHIGWRDGTTFYPHNKNQEVINIPHQFNQPDSQNIKECYADFISSIEQNKRPISDIEAGYYSTNISLLAMISYKLGRSIQWDGEKEKFVNDNEANSLLGKEYLNGWSLPG